MISPNVLVHFEAELEKLASVGRVRSLLGAVQLAEGNYKTVARALGPTRFIPGTEAFGAMMGARGARSAARNEFKVGLAEAQSAARQGAANLGEDAGEHAATLNAVRRAKLRLKIPDAFSPGEKAQAERAAASQSFRTRVALGGGALAAGGAYLAMRKKTEPQY